MKMLIASILISSFLCGVVHSAYRKEEIYYFSLYALLIRARIYIDIDSRNIDIKY